MRPVWLPVAIGLVLATPTGLAQAPAPTDRVEILRATGGLPAHVAGAFSEPLAFRQRAAGDYLVFDRRAHTIFHVDADRSAVNPIVQIGSEDGRVIQPVAFDLDAGGTFVVADAPRGLERVQIFNSRGQRIGGFTFPGRLAPRVTIGTLVVNGIGSLQYTGRSVIVNHPETGGLITEYSLSGRGVRTVGELRSTGQEHDRDLHLALNAGIPLVDPAGGYYFVFQTGPPVFRKYDETGRLVFERHIQGRELDPVVQNLPLVWPRREIDGRELPFVMPSVRAAAVDPDGRLWIALMVPYTYVYDPDGEKIRTVQFRAAGLLSPSSLSFAPGGRLLVTPGCYEFSWR